MARGSPVPIPDWHKCRRYWEVAYQCPFHGREPRDDEEETREDESEETRLQFTSEKSQKAPIPSEPQAGPTPQQAAVAEAVPVVAQQKTDRVLNAAAAASFKVPALPEAADVRGTPLYIPDEDIPQWTPPGKEGSIEHVGPASEEAFTHMLQEYPSRANARVIEKSQEQLGATSNDFTNLAWAFTGLFTANAVAHLWQSYNARINWNPVVKGGATPKPINTNDLPSRNRNNPQRGNRTIRTRPFPQPAPPPRVPVGASGPVRGTGGVGGLFFQSNPGAMEEPLPQQEFSNRFTDAVLSFQEIGI